MELVSHTPAVGFHLLNGSMARADQLVSTVSSFGGTGFIRKGPLRDTARAISRTAWGSMPADYPDYAHPGPGARESLDGMRAPDAAHAKGAQADITKPSKRRKVAQHAAAASKDGSAYKDDLREVRAVDAADNGNTALIFAAQAGHLEIVRYLAGERGAAVNAANANGCTALMVRVRGIRPRAQRGPFANPTGGRTTSSP